MTMFNSYVYAAGTAGCLFTPCFAAPDENYCLTFWMYRDDGLPGDIDNDRVAVYYNNIPDWTNGV